MLRKSKILERWRTDFWGGKPWEDVTFEVEDLFGQDGHGTMEKHMRFAEDPPKQKPDANILPRLMVLDFVWRIHTGSLQQMRERQEAERLEAQKSQDDHIAT